MESGGTPLLAISHDENRPLIPTTFSEPKGLVQFSSKIKIQAVKLWGKN